MNEKNLKNQWSLILSKSTWFFIYDQEVFLTKDKLQRQNRSQYFEELNQRFDELDFLASDVGIFPITGSIQNDGEWPLYANAIIQVMSPYDSSSLFSQDFQ